MRNGILFIYMVSVFFFMGQLHAQQWSWKFPKAGSNHLHAIKHLSGESWIAAGESGSLFKTTSNGASWYQVYSPAGNRYFEDIFAVNGSVIYASANRADELPEHITIKSTDGGESWFEIASAEGVFFSKLQFLNEQTGFALTGNRIFKTTNGGQSWSAGPYISAEYGFSDFHFVNENEGFTAGSFGAFAKTTDGGATWINSVTPYTNGLFAVWFISSTTGYIAGASNQIGRTTNGGASWITTTLEDVVGFYDIQFSGSTGYAVGWYGAIYKTTNTGVSWSRENVPGSSGENLYSVSLNGSETALASGQYGAVYLRNASSTWYDVNPRRLGSSTSIAWATAEKGFVTLSSGYLLSTTDSGETWSERPLIEGVYTTKAAFADPNHGVVFTWSDTFFYTSNGGSSWIKRLLPAGATAPNTAYFPSEFTGYAGGNNGSILKTTNRGFSWTHSTGPDGAAIHDIFFLNDSTGFIATPSNGIHKTTDGGATWVRKAYYQALSFSFPSSTVGYAAGWGLYMLKTTDAGETWLPVTVPNFSLHSYATVFVSELIGYVSGPHIYKTTDGGNNWFAERDAMGSSDRAVYDMELAPDGNLWAVSSFSGIHKLKETPATRGGLILPVTEAVAGNKIPVDVFIDVPLNRNFLSVQFSFNGYGSNLIFDSLSTSATISAGDGWYTSVNSADNTIRFAASGTFPHRGAGIIVRLWFTVAPGASGILPLNFISALIDNGAAPTDTMNGRISLLFPNYGDVDLNTFVQAYDASLVLQYVSSLIGLNDQQRINANVTTDAGITAFDASIILRYITGLITSLPYSGTDFAEGTISLADMNGASGSLIEIPVTFTNTSNIYSLNGKMNFDASMLEFDGVTWSDELAGFSTYSNAVGDEVHFASASSKSYTKPESSVIGTFRFKVKQTARPGAEAHIYVAELRLNENPLLYNAAGGKITIDGPDGSQQIPEEFGIQQNYPNPFNPATIIRVALPQQGIVSIKVYSITGALIKSETISAPAGYTDYRFNASGLPSGIYLALFEHDGIRKNIKMILTK